MTIVGAYRHQLVTNWNFWLIGRMRNSMWHFGSVFKECHWKIGQKFQKRVFIDSPSTYFGQAWKIGGTKFLLKVWCTFTLLSSSLLIFTYLDVFPSSKPSTEISWRRSAGTLTFINLRLSEILTLQKKNWLHDISRLIRFINIFCNA